MWKILLALLAITAAMMVARILYDPPAIGTGTREAPARPAMAYAGVRG